MAVRTEVKLSEDEAAILVPRAEELGISLPRLLVEAALTPAGETPTERRNALTQLFALHRTLAGAANNLNQLAKHANADGIVPAEAEAQKWQILELCVRISDLVEAIGEGRLPHLVPAGVEDDDEGDDEDEWEAVDDVLTGQELPDTERLRWLLTGMLMATVPVIPLIDSGYDKRHKGEPR
ncbi:plasmid mobilization relaxosome protein MobC [Kribbella sp. NPDC059898]|uniref:plasmid mobilization relaxosome protein MobC n=1 Tax=Kribbella sp. NPDC059898 TaxID=3346995 RepID=UPI00365B6003